VPEHAPGFWEALDAELADDRYVRPPVVRRRRRWPALAAAAALVVVAGLGALLTRDAGRPVTDEPVPLSSTTTSTPEQRLPGAVAAASAFLRAAVAGDESSIPDLIGPGSKAFAQATGRTVASLLTDEVWLDPAKAGLLDVTVDRDHVVVVAEADGDVRVLPVRRVAGEWRAEPWAFVPAEGPVGVTLVSGDTAASGDAVQLTTPADGVVHVGLDRELGDEVQTSNRTAAWTPTAVGVHRLLTALVDGDVFVADVAGLTISEEPASAEGAAGMFRHAWLVGDREAMARYGTAAAVDQAAAIPIEGWGTATDDGCEGAAGSAYCTWTRDDGARLILRVGNVERPPRVQEVRVES
jgi:hypothetical protein